MQLRLPAAPVSARDTVTCCWPSCNIHGFCPAQVHFTAKNGQPGQGSQRNGADGDDLYVSVPPGEPACSACWHHASMPHECASACTPLPPKPSLTTKQQRAAKSCQARPQAPPRLHPSTSPLAPARCRHHHPQARCRGGRGAAGRAAAAGPGGAAGGRGPRRAWQHVLQDSEEQGACTR